MADGPVHCVEKVGDTQQISGHTLVRFNPSLYTYIKYIWFRCVGFYGISTIVGYLMPNPLYINIYIKYAWFGWVEFYGT